MVTLRRSGASEACAISWLRSTMTQFATLREVVSHYTRAPAAPAGHSELKPLGLSAREIDQLVAFLGTLSGPVRADAKWLQAPAP